MKTIADLTTTASALMFLDSRPDDEIIELSGHGEVNTPESDAVAKITGDSCNSWCASHNRWEWTKKELIAALID